eukprot:s1727_g3.t1
MGYFEIKFSPGLSDNGCFVAFVVLKDMVFDIYHFGIKSSPAFQSLQLMGVPSWKVFLGIAEQRWSKYRYLERLTCLLSVFASCLEIPKRFVCVFTWTIDAEYPHETTTYYFYFAETKVELTNVPVEFDEKFKAWANEKAAERERAAKSVRPKPVRFDVALANEAVQRSAPRDLFSWVVPSAILFCDIFELIIVRWLQSADPALIKYRLCRFARLFLDPVLIGMVLSCHICCNSDLYLTFAKLKF